ncbi:putative mitochondrial protein AtMg00310 [Carex rostrata]
MWKSALLSPAGRLVLIRTVLLALPIYYMATSRIPKAVLDEITSMVRRFFWGKVDKQRYLAYVSWDKIMQPVEMGGLGVRDLQATNESMLMKFLWRMAAGSEALWVKIVKAKYFPRSDLWHSKRDYKCTGFWNNMMKLRAVLQLWLQWRIGGGDVCGAFAQPWFKGALDCKPTEESQRQLLVRDLMDVESGSWDVDRLIQCFGYTNCMEILANVEPPIPGATGDSLIFNKRSGVAKGKNVSLETNP